MMRGAIVLGLALPMLLGTPAPALSPGRAGEFDARWHDGRAEVDGYALTVTRYGHARAGRGVLIFVTEPFSRSRQVKLDDPSRAPGDAFEVLKLNLIRDFQTGIYDYHTMVSLFVDARAFTPVKQAFTSAEWCGQVYEEIEVHPGRIVARGSSYFEGESSLDSLARPAGGVLEDDLFIRLRGLRGDDWAA